MVSQSATSVRTNVSEEEKASPRRAGTNSCPACGEPARQAPIERYERYELFECAVCGLQFWEPRHMPDAQWYERTYRGRDQELLPLEPGHKYFLADELAPPGGELLDIGCGTGNFLMAAREAGYHVTGIELDRNAVRFARERAGLPRVFPLSVSEFAERYSEDKFQVVTFFEVLEHQAEPVEFLQKVRRCVWADGVIALSVPNRERWLTGPDVLDYPPNHFLRWNAAALRKFLGAHGFEVLSMREQPAGVKHTAQMIHMALRTGMTRTEDGKVPASFRDVIQMPADKAEAVLQAKPKARERVMQTLGRIKHAACFPLAVAAFPYIRMRHYKGTYLYCLARK